MCYNMYHEGVEPTWFSSFTFNPLYFLFAAAGDTKACGTLFFIGARMLQAVKARIKEYANV